MCQMRGVFIYVYFKVHVCTEQSSFRYRSVFSVVENQSSTVFLYDSTNTVLLSKNSTFLFAFRLYETHVTHLAPLNSAKI